MRVFIVGTDHRLQQSIAPAPAGGGWIQRTGGRSFRRGITHFLTVLEAKAICEEAHERQEETAPTLCSVLAKEHNVPWVCMAMGEPDLRDGLFDFSRFPPEIVAGRCRLDKQAQREEYMGSVLRETLTRHGTVLAVVGYMHAGVLARQFEKEGTLVELFQMTAGLVMDETQT